jgi:uncharacterized membrane protein
VSDRALRNLCLVLVVAGAIVAGYLVEVYYSGEASLCVGGGGSCERVQTSDYADLVGVPVALLGLIGYVGIGAALLVPGDRARVAAAFMAIAGFGFSAYLTYIELFVIDAICHWCVASAVLMTALAVAASLRFARGG